MASARKLKVSVSLSEDLVERIDREAARSPGQSRSGVIEAWLWRASKRAAAASLAAETIAYYEKLTDAERAEDEAWAAFGTEELARRGDE